MESIRLAGLNADGLPKLAIGRADAKECHLQMDEWGGGYFGTHNFYWKNSAQKIAFPRGFFPRPSINRSPWRTKAALPFIPPQHRPKRGLENYHILWEAEWEKKPPVDPYLLRRIGKSDMWMVLAAWDLTPVEQAVMKTRMLMM
jgi:hypothetical protein